MTYHSIYIAWDLDTIVVEPVIRNASLSYFSICLQVWRIEITIFYYHNCIGLLSWLKCFHFFCGDLSLFNFCDLCSIPIGFPACATYFRVIPGKFDHSKSVMFSYRSITSHICCAMYTKYTKSFNICIPQVIRFIKYNLQIINLLDYLNHSR